MSALHSSAEMEVFGREFDEVEAAILRVAAGRPHAVFEAPWSQKPLGPSAVVVPRSPEWEAGVLGVLVQRGGGTRVEVLGPAPTRGSAPWATRPLRRRDFSAPQGAPGSGERRLFSAPPRPKNVRKLALAEAEGALAGEPSSSPVGDRALRLALVAHGDPAGLAAYARLRGAPAEVEPEERARLEGKEALRRLGAELCKFLTDALTKM